MSEQVVATPELLEEWIFDKGRAEVLLAEQDGRPVGFALFFHLPRACRDISGGFVRTAGSQRQRGGQGAAAGAGASCSGTRLRTAGMGLSGLERSEHRLLSGAGGRTHGGLDDLPPDRGKPAAHGRGTDRGSCAARSAPCARGVFGAGVMSSRRFPGCAPGRFTARPESTTNRACFIMSPCFPLPLPR